MAFSFRGYAVEEQIYDGPGSHVYRARRLADGLPVVLKVLKPALPPPERLARFRLEYQTLSSLSHPGIVKACGLETDELRWVLVQEDIGGQPLDRFLARHPLPLEERLDLALRIVGALEQVHEQRLIHKDINPSNIVWNPESRRLVLIDFGIATRLSHEHPTVRPLGQLEGTLAYIAPEQTGRMNRDVDYRSDYYSLGVTLHQLVTGERPFNATDALELVHCHIARKPPPAHHVAPDVPEAVSAILLKLMAKMAEARYQSSYGIKADLSACLEQVRATGTVTGLAVGGADIPEQFQIPQKLYGRESELEALISSFERVAGGAGRVEWVLVKGYAGIGKSALVHELQGPLTARRGYFAAGKFDQLQRSTPYSAISSAFRSLARQLLGEREDRLAQWRERLLAALGPNARLITGVVPEMALIIGPQPPVPELGSAEAQNRFNLAFQNFVRAFARREHPLVLFLDDLQWADLASLKLLERLMSDDRPSHLLLIGAYRDNEVDPAHPLMMSLGALRQTGATLHEIHLSSLQLDHTTEFVADILHSSRDTAAPLAQLLMRKTEGNPFFISQFLKEVHGDGLITLDRQQGRWLWDLARIEARGITDNVVDLMVGKLRRQPEMTQEALRFAACLGNRFSLEALATIREQSLAAAYTALLPALAEGFALAASEPELALSEAPGAPMAAREYRFLHDRVQHAAYSLMDASERKNIHLRAGRLLLRRLAPEEREERVFELVDQLNHGLDLLEGTRERMEIVRLNLLAGRKAKAAAAYTAARDYLSIAFELLLGTGLSAQEHALAWSLQYELSEAEALAGNFVPAREWAERMLEQARTPLEQAEAFMLLTGQQTMLGRNAEAVKLALEGLAVFGVELPSGELERASAAEAAAIHERMRDRPISSLLEEPLVRDARASIILRLLVSAMTPSFYTDPPVYRLIVLKAVRTSLEYGLSPQSGDLFAFYGLLLALQGEYRAGYEFGELSVRLSEKLRSPGGKCRGCFLLANFLLAWVKPLRQARLINDDGYQAGLEGGELLFGGFILFYKLLQPFYEGVPLEQILTELPAYLQFNQRAKNQLGADLILSLRLAMGMLTGSQDAKELSEAEYLQGCEQRRTTKALWYYYILKAQALYLLRQPAQALQAADIAERVTVSLSGNVATAEHRFYAALALAALLPQTSGEQRADFANRLQSNLERLARWAEGCPENFAHMHALVAAEQARVNRQPQAMELYEQAISSAHRNGFAQDEALANELAGRFWLDAGKHRLGIGYMAEALHGYRQWGAQRKVEALSSEFPELATPLRVPGATTTDRQSASALDLSSVLKASNVISSELVLDKLLTKLMQIVTENAGAEQSVLLLARGGGLFVYVEAHLRQAEAGNAVTLQVLEPIPLARSQAVPEGLIVYVHRTRETVLLGNACREGAFTQLDYFQEHRTMSVLAMPLTGGQGKPLGVLYLENNLTAEAFTPAHLEVLRLLSSQVGISLENALLYSELEQRVEERTGELQRKNETLLQTLHSLEKTQAQLIHAEKMASLGQLTAGIAHELKNPMNFIISFATNSVDRVKEIFEAAAGKPGLTVAQVEEALEDVRLSTDKIAEHSWRADGIIRSMMQHASGGSRERRRVDLNGLVEQYVSLAFHSLRAQQRAVQLAIQREYDPAAGEVELGPQDIGRVLLNLLHNAFDVTLDKQRKVGNGYMPSITVSTLRRGGAVEIRVEDNGTGIPAQIRERIFEPFFSTKPAGAGTGLGLSISYDIVVQGHQGNLVAESKEGQGASFTVTLPAA
jgi:predicted ATPase/signal transduction histidine kinase/tRNA A-37 threonylcarbamoyl transferase component Bud32